MDRPWKQQQDKAADHVIALWGTPSHSNWHEMDLTGACVLLPVMAGVIGSHNGSSGAADAQMLPMGSGNIPKEFAFVE